MRGLKDRLTDALYGLGWGTVKKLPEPVAVRLGRTIADMAWKRRGKGVLRLESNSRAWCPTRAPERLAELSRAGMRSYLRYWMESFRLPAWSAERIRDGFDVKDVHHLTDGLASGTRRHPRPAAPGQLGPGRRLGHHRAGDARSPRSPSGSSRSRCTTGSSPTARASAWRCCRTPAAPPSARWPGGCATGGLVCLVADRDLSASGVEVEFFGDTARMPAGPALLAQQTGALLLPVTLWYDDSPVMQGRVHPPVEVPETGTRAEKTSVMTQALADAFATGIAEHPEDWHMLQRLWLADLRAPTRAAGASSREDRHRLPVLLGRARAASSSTSATWPST